MALYTDVHDYVLSTSSSPWRLSGLPHATIESGYLKLPQTSHGEIQRITPLSGNYILQCNVEMIADLSGQATHQIAFGLASTGAALTQKSFPAVFYRPNYPISEEELTLWPSNAWIAAGSQGVASVNTYLRFGSLWNPAYTPNFNGLPAGQWLSQGGLFSFSVQFYVRPSTRQVAMRVVKDAVTYRSEWQQPFDSGFITDFTRPWIRDAGGCRVGTITIYDGLQDAEIDSAESSGETPVLPPPIPTVSSLLPDSTGKLSHARILRGFRSPSQAQAFHNLMKEMTA